MIEPRTDSIAHIPNRIYPSREISHWVISSGDATSLYPAKILGGIVCQEKKAQSPLFPSWSNYCRCLQLDPDRHHQPTLSMCESLGYLGIHDKFYRSINFD